MKIVRFEDGGETRYGILEGGEIRPLAGGPFQGIRASNERFQAEDVRLLAPVQPSKVVAVGLNYRDHAEEVGEPIPDYPLLFMKPSTAVIGPGDPIVHIGNGERVDFEAELAAVVGRTAFRVSEDHAAGYLLGYTCLNDVTARDIQRRDGQWTRSKSFDTFCPLGPWVETELDPDSAPVRARLNGEERQSSSTANLIFPVFRLVSLISYIMTLLPGDIVSTGTPSGIGPMQPGDVIEVEVGGIGVLRNQVAAPDLK